MRSRSSYSKGANKGATPPTKTVSAVSKDGAIEKKTSELPIAESKPSVAVSKWANEKAVEAATTPAAPVAAPATKELPEKRTRRLSADAKFADALAIQAAKSLEDHKSVDKKSKDSKGKKSADTSKKVGCM